MAGHDGLLRAVAGPPKSFMLGGIEWRLTRSWTSPMMRVSDSGDRWCVPFLTEALRNEREQDDFLDWWEDDVPWLSAADLAPAAQGIVESVTGWPWYSGARLTAIFMGSWQILDGRVRAASGLNLAAEFDRDPSRALNVLWSILHEGKEEDVQKLEFDIDKPPAGMRMTPQLEAKLAAAWDPEL